jgi:FdhE protein
MTRWQRRIDRAAELARLHPESAPWLNLYAGIARFQSQPSRSRVKLTALLGTRGGADDRFLPSANPALGDFCERVLAQADAEERAHSARVPAGVQPLCPFCAARPVCAVLRPESDGGKRFLLCSRCFTEWEFRRLLCPHCGEEDKDKLPVYTAEQFPYVRVEACDTCRVYLKAINLTKNGLAVPEVDELATAALDVWAAEQGYTKLQDNLFGL